MTHSRFFTYGPKKYLILCLPVVFVIAGCTSSPVTTDSLLRARSAYAKVQSDAKITANAPVASYEADQALKQAEQASDAPAQEHLAYLAERKARIAVADAEKNMADKEVQLLQKEKETALFKIRENEAEKAKSEAEMAELKGKQTERGIVLTLGDVFFETGRAALMPGGLQAIGKLASFLKKYPDRGVLIEGHTDSVGKAEYNIRLSQIRAEAVRNALLENGISAGRITTKGYGKAYPVASNATAGGRQLNRRVEIVVLNRE